MLIRSWFELALQCVYRVTLRRRVRRRLLRTRHRPLPVACEVLEDLTMLSSGLSFTAAADTPQNLTLRVDGTNVQVVDSANASRVLASESLANITNGVQISGNGFDVNLTVDSSIPAIQGGIVFTGGSGTNTLSGPAADTIWHVTGPGSGDLTSGLVTVQFTGVEHLTGGASGVDSFVI